jgi:hypothetical protein
MVTVVLVPGDSVMLEGLTVSQVGLPIVVTVNAELAVPKLATEYVTPFDGVKGPP